MISKSDFGVLARIQPGFSMDYSCDNRRFWLSAHKCQVPTPTSQNLELDQQSRILPADWLSNCLERLKSTIPNLQIYLPKKANSGKLGLGLDNPCRIVFLSLQTNKCLGRVNWPAFWNPGVFRYAMIPWCRPNSRVFFFIVTSIVYGLQSLLNP